MTVTLLTGDCREVMAGMDAESIDAVVTDPPYDLTNRVPDVKKCRVCGRVLGGNDGKPDFCPRCGGELYNQRSQGRGFMGKDWDGTGVAFDPATWEAALRVLKPGTHLLAFGGTRTFHRMTCAIEDAGFEIKDCLSWLYGSGFPKHKSLLKPAWEPIILARKPGPGLLNIDACRIGTTRGVPASLSTNKAPNGIYSTTHAGDERDLNPNLGRWPANVVLSHIPPDEHGNGGCKEVGTRRVKTPPGGRGPRGANRQATQGATHGGTAGGYNYGGESPMPRYADPDGYETVAAWDCAPDCPILLLDAQSGERRSEGGSRGAGGRHGAYSPIAAQPEFKPGYGDSGGASRFYYVAKASRSERGEGNHHPTVKPLALMRWLVRLVCPPGGIVLDPFLGSGTTLVACELEGLHGVGIEQSPEYLDIARRRIAAAAPPKPDPNKPRQLSLEGAAP